MATFPKDIPAFRDALLAFVVPPASEGATEEQVEAIATMTSAVYASHTTASPVVQMVQVYDAMKGRVDLLDTDGKKLLAGAAYLIGQGSFFGKGAEAFDALTALLPALEA